MSDVRVPREAIDAAAMAFSARAIPSLVTYAKAESAIAAALPFLRAQWEADLLSDEAIQRATAVWRLYMQAQRRWDLTMRQSLRAALGSCVRSIKDDE